MSIERLRQNRRDLKVNISQVKTRLGRLQSELARVEVELNSTVPREMTKPQIEAALGYRVKLIPQL